MAVAAHHHLVNNAPIGNATQVAVVNKQLGLQFAGTDNIRILLWKIAIHGIELQSLRSAIINGLLKQLAFTASPKNELMMSLLLQLLERFNSKRNGVVC